MVTKEKLALNGKSYGEIFKPYVSGKGLSAADQALAAHRQHYIDILLANANGHGIGGNPLESKTQPVDQKANERSGL